MKFVCGTCAEEPAIKAYYFRMERKGRGWKTTGLFTRDGDAEIPPVTKWEPTEDIPFQFTSLGKIKRYFSESVPLTYVIESHLSAPSEIYQVIVKFRDSDDWKEREKVWKGTKETLSYDVHYEYKYVSDVPKKVLVNWENY